MKTAREEVWNDSCFKLALMEQQLMKINLKTDIIKRRIMNCHYLVFLAWQQLQKTSLTKTSLVKVVLGLFTR